MPFRIDGTLYPDDETPRKLDSIRAKVDFLARLCSSWDFGILPDEETIKEIRRESWREAVDQCRLLTSPTYHLLREWHGLPVLPYIGDFIPYIREDPNLEYI